MSVQQQLAKVEELAKEKADAAGAGFGRSASKEKQPLSEDAQWVRQNLRFEGGQPVMDIANVLRIFERHEDYKGRFKYNDMVNRAMDKGAVMVDWRIFELCAVVQERFLPGLDNEVMLKALIVAANKASEDK